MFLNFKLCELPVSNPISTTTYSTTNNNTELNFQGAFLGTQRHRTEVQITLKAAEK